MDSMPFTIKKVGTSQLQRDASVLSHCTRALLSFLHGTPTFLMTPRYPGAGRVAYGVMAGRAGYRLEGRVGASSG